MQPATYPDFPNITVYPDGRIVVTNISTPQVEEIRGLVETASPNALVVFMWKSQDSELYLNARPIFNEYGLVRGLWMIHECCIKPVPLNGVWVDAIEDAFIR